VPKTLTTDTLYDEHEDILAALESRNVTQGVKALTAHIDMSGEKVVEVVKEGLVKIYLRESSVFASKRGTI